jgi:hypothetical protein
MLSARVDVAALIDDLTDYLDRNKATGLTAGRSTVRIVPELRDAPRRSKSPT